MDNLQTTLVVISIIAVSLSIIAILYITLAFRRRAITMKKIDYLVEDITYKSEMLNSTVETISKISNYVDAFELVARKNMKSATKIISRNKEDIYKIANRIKLAAMGEAGQKNVKSKKKGGR